MPSRASSPISSALFSLAALGVCIPGAAHAQESESALGVNVPVWSGYCAFNGEQQMVTPINRNFTLLKIRHCGTQFPEIQIVKMPPPRALSEAYERNAARALDGVLGNLNSNGMRDVDVRQASQDYGVPCRSVSFSQREDSVEGVRGFRTLSVIACSYPEGERSFQENSFTTYVNDTANNVYILAVDDPESRFSQSDATFFHAIVAAFALRN